MHFLSADPVVCASPWQLYTSSEIYGDSLLLVDVGDEAPGVSGGLQGLKKMSQYLQHLNAESGPVVLAVELLTLLSTESF